jgi:hypothetical protein
MLHSQLRQPVMQERRHLGVDADIHQLVSSIPTIIRNLVAGRSWWIVQIGAIVDMLIN